MAYAGKAGERDFAPTPGPPAPKSMNPMIMGLALGLLVGAGVALLLAPERGVDTRRVLKRGMRRARLRSRDAWADLRLELLHARRELKRAKRRAKIEAAQAALV